MLSLCRSLIDALSLLVPRRIRREWRREWHAELVHRSRLPQRTSHQPSPSRLDLLLRTVGAWRDAAWLRAQDWSLDMILQDLRYAWRTLRQRPAFTAIATSTLALGIGANAVIFSFLSPVVLEPLPYERPDELVRLRGTAQDGVTNLNPIDVEDYRGRSSLVVDIAAATSGSDTLIGGGEPLRLNRRLVWPGFFSVLGEEPLLGRGFSEEELIAGNHRVAVISHALWQSRFGGDPEIVGRALQLSGEDYTVIGVAPPGFLDPFDGNSSYYQLWRPYPLDRTRQGRGGHFLQGVARLRPGASLEQASAELQGIAADLAETYPDTNGDIGVRVEPLQSSLVGDARTPALLLLAAVGLLLLIACANVASLLLARALRRQQEVAIRWALGADRLRLVRQLLTESALLSLLGGALGVLLAYLSLPALIAALPADIPRLETVALDAEVLLAAFGLSLLTALIFGLAPALQASSPCLRSAGGRRGGPGLGRQRLRQTLVIAQVALSLVLLISAGLLAKSFLRVLQTDPGFDASGLLTARLSLPSSQYPERHQVTALLGELESNVSALPGVLEAGSVNRLPLRRSASCDSFGLGDRPDPPLALLPCAEERTITAGYFRTMGIDLVAGRPLLPSDDAAAPPVIVINRAMARRFWPDRDPLGQQFKWGHRESGEEWNTIVGVVDEVRHFGIESESEPEVYTLHAQRPFARTLYLAVRTDGDPLALAADLRRELHALDDTLPLFEVAAMSDLVSASVAPRRLTSGLMTAFAGIALGLSVIGLYGLIAFLVAQRRGEIGIRLAMGARPGQVAGLFLRQSLLLVLPGLVIGVLAALGLSRVLGDLLYGVSPTDPGTFGAVAAFLLAITLAATYLPSRRAARIDPAESLRDE